ncbi:methyltransferase domain-containing protein [Mycobacterium sp.]|uniref:methyltransferase domain-containing protein n=1 Tax=Mycobacterium sp. TaxID=1785 RepID=UPI003BB09C34
MLITLSDIRDILTCPRCRGPLRDGAAGLQCAQPSCGLAHQTFPMVAEQPALIDFDQSIIDRAELLANAGSSCAGLSYEERSRGTLERTVSRVIFGYNRVAEAKVSQILADFKTLARPSRLLVIGGGAVGSGVQALYDDPEVQVVGTDIYHSPHLTLIADGHRLPFADESVDGVWIQAVLEHVLDPQQVVAEIHRVLRPDGLVFADTPFMQQVHEGAYDFTRFTLSGHRWLFRHFALIDAGNSGGAGLATLWSVRYLARAITGSGPLGTLAQLAFFWLRFLDRWSGPRDTADAASAVYFYGRKSPVPISPKDIVAFYDEQNTRHRQPNRPSPDQAHLRIAIPESA